MAARAELKALFCTAGLAALSLAVGLAFTAPASAQQSCEADIGKIQQKRMTTIGELNKLQQKDGGKLDPIEACPRLRTLASTEKEMLSYMEKNQAWCNIPDDALASMKDTQGKTSKIATQACNIAAQVKKQQQQQQAQGGMAGFAPPPPKLPAGPL